MDRYESGTGETKSQPVFRVPAVVGGLIAALVAVHGTLALAGPDWEVWALYAFSFIPARISGDVAFPSIPGTQIWAFLTYAFLHGDWLHLLFNSLWLLVFGSVVARRLGPWRFLLLAAVSAVAGAVASLLLYWGEAVIMVGASGAVSGLMAAAIPLMYARGIVMGDTYRTEISSIMPLRPAEILTNGRALFFIAIWIGITLFSGASGWVGTEFVEDARIAWEAHLGGFAAGFVTFYRLDRSKSV